MATFGFAYQAAAISGLDASSDEDRKTRSKLYGFFDPARAATFGYRPANTGPALRPQGYPTDPQELGVLTGADPQSQQPVRTFAGKAVPTGGCDAEGLRAVGGSLPAPVDDSLPDGGPSVPISDPRVVVAFADWHKCMYDAGFDYTTPTDAFLDTAWQQDLTQSAPSARQIATAVADVRCKIALNTVGKTLAVQVAYDTRYVTKHATQLASYRDQLAKYMLIGR